MAEEMVDRGVVAAAYWQIMDAIADKITIRPPWENLFPERHYAQVIISNTMNWNGSSTGFKQRRITDVSGTCGEIAGRRFLLSLVNWDMTVDLGLKVVELFTIDHSQLEFEDIPSASLGIKKVEILQMLAEPMHAYAKKNGFVSAVPTANEGVRGGVHVLGAHMVRESAVEQYVEVFASNVKEENETERVVSISRAPGVGFGDSSLRALRRWSSKFYGDRPCVVVDSKPGSHSSTLRLAFLKQDISCYIKVNEQSVFVSSFERDTEALQAASEWNEAKHGPIPPYGPLMTPDGTEMNIEREGFSLTEALGRFRSERQNLAEGHKLREQIAMRW